MTGRVLFHYPILNRGGAEASSLRMMSALADRGWFVSLVLTTGGGSLEPSVDHRVEIVRLRPGSAGDRFKKARGLRRLAEIPDLLRYLANRGIGAVRMLRFLLRRYDAAAVLLMGTPSLFIRRFVRARTRAIWIRNDLAGADPTGQVTQALKRHASEIDHFICVSKTALDSLVTAIPEVGGKAEVVYNILRPEDMRARAREGQAPFSNDRTTPTILTVCRLAERPKALLRMVAVAQRLRADGFDFRWYIAGDGPDRKALEDAIRTAGLDQVMIVLGMLPNPFPAYAAADIVAMLSRYEGLCGAINEARVMGRAVIATQVSGIDEQLKNGQNGVIVPQDEDAIVDGLKQLLSDAGLRARLASGGYPRSLLDDEAKLDRLEEIFLSGSVQG